MNGKLAIGWARVSLRAKLTALSVAIIGLLLIISSLGTVALLRTYLQANVDNVLIKTAQTMSREDPALIQARLATRQIQLPALPTDYYMAYLDTTGTFIIGFSQSTKPNDPVPNFSTLNSAAVNLTKGIPFEIDEQGRPIRELNEGRGWRILAVPLNSQPGTFVVALPVDNNNALITQYRNIGAGFGGLLLVLSALAIWITISSALRPLKEVERTADAVAAGDFGRRLIEQDSKTEVGRINSALNTMLSSIESAMDSRSKALEQMRRFVSDASHELRTPLASVRGYAELYRMGALSKKPALDDAMSRIESEAIRMAGLVDSLLTLARLDESTELALGETNLVPIALAAAKDAAVAEHKRNILVTNFEGEILNPDHRINAKVDASAFRQVLTNLLANASRFSPANQNVELVLGLQGNKTVVEVRDHGEGIPKQLREKVFERFFRADNSRNRETGGSGLGLSIVKTILDRHNATISALETDGGGTTMRIELA
jgi:two-component system OmpR family sensor kinase